MNQATGRMTAAAGNQKIVFLTQRSQNAGVNQTQQNAQGQQNTVVKFVSNAPTSNQQKMVTTQQKLVVVCMPNSNTTTSVSTQGLQTQMTQQQQIQLQKQLQQQVDDLSHLS